MADGRHLEKIGRYSASEVTTIWRYTNVYIIIIIIEHRPYLRKSSTDRHKIWHVEAYWLSEPVSYTHLTLPTILRV